MNFVETYVVITGGANGIGRCIAEAFVKESASVIIINIDIPAGERLQNQYKSLQFFHGDIADKKVLEGFVNSLEQPVNCLINNACISRRGLLSECSYEDFKSRAIKTSKPNWPKTCLSTSGIRTTIPY